MTDKYETDSTRRRLSAMLRTAFCPVVRAALESDATIEVMVNPDGSVWLEEAGRGLIPTDHVLSAGDRERVIRLVASSLGAATSHSASIVSDFRLSAGGAELGAAWRQDSKDGETPYLSVKLDDPSFAQPMRAAFFENEKEGTGVMVWNRPK